ncbi:Aro80p [Sugiyamaella lignohabitans]|uniref:Aro80p n=1 Tax=Sugiyamaella lignohabitans TaxID=796027 RepID=A0A167FUV9_9ASCO|nr:Aro80p [Sugiyamaella lignohabitans]ANB15731.1 Aro80p [Sugiyamaella lignohabitans]
MSSSVSPENAAETFLRKRAFKACLHCRSKKAKCQFEGVDFNPPCLRCRREGKECRFVPSRRGGGNRNRVAVDTLSHQSVTQVGNGSSSIISNTTTDITGINGLAGIDGDLSNGADLRHNPTSSVIKSSISKVTSGRNEKKGQLSGSENNPDHGPAHSPTSTVNSSDYSAHSYSHKFVDAESIADHDLRNPADAVEMMALANHSQFKKGDIVQIQKQNSQSHPAQLSDVNLVRVGILSPTELKTYVSLFFNRYHHFMPIVPESKMPLNDQQLVQFALKEPILLCAMVVVATRYESILIHKACWKYFQLEISSLVWGGKPNTGIVEALLLISDNLPLITDADVSTEDEEIHKYEERLSWNLVGLAIRNSYLMGFDQKTLLSVSEVTDEDTHRQRLAWTYCYIFDRQTSVRAGKAFWSRGPGICFQNQVGFGLPVGQTSIMNFPTLASSILGDENAAFVQVMLEVTQILTNVHDSLYPSRDRTIALAEVGDYCRLLDEFIRTFSEFEITWESRQWRIPPVNEMVWMSFHFSALYAYSFGFQAHIRRAIAMVRLARQMNPTADGDVPIVASIFPRGVTATADSKYILESIKAATKIVSICVNELSPSGLLSYLPYRFYGYISYAAVFLIKAVFTGAISSSSQPATLGLLDRLIRNLETIGTENNTSRQNYYHPCAPISEQLKFLMNSLLSFNEEHKHSPEEASTRFGPDETANEFHFELNDDDLDQLNSLLTLEVNENWLNLDL